MKRSDSVLVYGVTGLLLVILVIAVVFGSESRAAGADPMDQSGLSDPTDLTGLIDGIAESSELEAEGDPAADPTGDPSGDPAGDPAGEAGGDPDQPGSDGGLDDDAGQERGGPAVPLRTRDVQLTLGVHEVVERPNGKFRMVKIRRGDTFSELIERWGVDSADVLALNEELDVNRLKIGRTLCLPFVPDQILLDAFDERRSRPRPTPTPARVEPAPARPATVSGVAGEHVLKEGESLWKIAVREVGAGKANAYIDALVVLNGISDRDRIRAGTRLKLPAH